MNSGVLNPHFTFKLLVMYWRIRQFIKGVKNLIRWFPIIWKDRDWDHTYIFEILKFKLKNQSEYIGKNDNHVSAKYDAEKMMLCVRLIERIQDEYYGCEYQDYNKINYKFIDTESDPKSWRLELEQISENFDDYFKKYPRIYNQLKDKYPERYRLAFQIAMENENRAYKLLFKILEQNIRRWWD